MKKLICTLLLVSVAFCATFAEEVTVSVEAGEHWKEKREPQFAIWLESENGDFIRTLYVTKKAAKKSFIFSPKEGRPESLPVWYNASKAKKSDAGVASSAAVPSEKQNEFDAVSSATPKGGVVFSFDLDDGKYVIRAEFNTSFDYNEFYTKKNSGVNGQPSVVYESPLSLRLLSNKEVELYFAGTGSLKGEDGEIHKGTKNLTSATQIVKTVRLFVR